MEIDKVKVGTILSLYGSKWRVEIIDKDEYLLKDTKSGDIELFNKKHLVSKIK